MTVALRPISAAAAEALRTGQTPPDVTVAPDYPTEFSAGVGQQAGKDDGRHGPFFIHRGPDGVVVGEVGGALIAPGTIEIGYAIVTSCWGRGYATDAVRQLIERTREGAGIERIVAHTLLDRPASGRVLEKAGFSLAGEVDDEHDGVSLRVREWHLDL